MAEKFQRTLLLMFTGSCYFIYNARRDTAAEKEFDIVIEIWDDTRVRSSSEIQEKKKWQKNNFKQRHVNVTKRANSSRIMI